MTSLPTTTSAEKLPGAAPALAAHTPLAEGLAALFAPTAGVPANPAPGPLVPEFTVLLDSTAPTVPTVAALPAGPSTTPASAAPATGATPNAPASPAARSCTDEAAALAREGALPSSLTDARELGFAPAKVSPSDVTEAEAALPPRAAQRDPAPVVTDRATLEAVVALLAPVMNAIAPPTPVGPSADGFSPAGSAPQANDMAPALADPRAEKRETSWPRTAQFTFTAPGQAPVALLEQRLAAAAAPAEAAPQTLRGDEPAKTPRPSGDAAMSPAAPSAVAPARAAVPSPVPAPGVPEVEVSAAVELANGSVVAVALPKAPERGAAPAPLPAVRPEKSAGVSEEKNLPDSARDNLSGKNFLSAEEQGLSPVRGKAGIAVAETRPIMFAAPHVTLPAVSPTVPALVAMESVAPQAAAPAPEPMPQLVAVSLAHRAVETVTNVVEAQAASKLQPVPSVQLKFKIGADDLAVRIELRGGVVRTEFRTDSPELRAAIASEWKSVTAQPEAALRFLEPVVTAAASNSGGANAFSQQQHQHSPGQSAAQQQQQQQQQSRAAAEVFGSVGRSTPFQPREGGAAQSNVSPIALPTSVHLSAVA